MFCAIFFLPQIKGFNKYDKIKEISQSDKINALENFLQSIQNEYDELSRCQIDGIRKNNMVKVSFSSKYLFYFVFFLPCVYIYYLYIYTTL